MINPSSDLLVASKVTEWALHLPRLSVHRDTHLMVALQRRVVTVAGRARPISSGISMVIPPYVVGI